MKKEINLIGISGSLRKDSYNTLLLKNVQKVLDENVKLTIVDIANIPLYDEDDEKDAYPKEVKALMDQLYQADGFVFATPEYNYSYGPALKNVLDWASRIKNGPLNEKYVAIMSAAKGSLGGVRAQNHLRDVLRCINMYAINKPEVYITSAHTKFDENGNLNDEMAIKLIKELMNSLIAKIKK